MREKERGRKIGDMKQKQKKFYLTEAGISKTTNFGKNK